MRPPEKNAEGKLQGDPSLNFDVATQALEAVSPAFVGLSYLFNPFVIFSCLAFSLQNLHHLTMCAAIALASCGRGGLAAAMLGVALYVCPWTPVVLLLPIAYLAYGRGPGSAAEDVDCKANVYVPSRS